MADLDQQIEQARARLRDLQARASKQRRRDETKKKIIYGAAILALIEALEDSKKKTKAMEKLHAKITRRSDRDFLGLSNATEDIYDNATE
ncbi:hypothetical protein [uncultured Ruegeria sp.]|uniref:hypothetical protein n=1 Tax=uncultured Ruegeria sp. TaxID=259304 RepID=UPI002625042D|nr:hypothetical protein [uncultured Ruegeria sp.]